MTRMRWIGGLLIGLLLVGILHGETRGDIGVATLGIDVRLAPGKSATGSFLVINNSEEPAHVQVRVEDFERTPDGGVRLLPPGSLPNSLADFISVFPQEFTLAGGRGQTQEVVFTISLPEGAGGPHWSILLVQEVPPTEDQDDGPPDEDGKNAQARLRVNFGVQIRQVDLTNAINDGKITDMAVLLPRGDRSLEIVTEYKNTGTLFQRPQGEVRIIDARGEIVRTVEIFPFWVLPGGVRHLEIPVEDALPPGEYVALTVLDFGGDFLVAGQARFSLP
jgi:hypothetical protein